MAWALGLACQVLPPSHAQGTAVSPQRESFQDQAERRQAEREAVQAGELQKGVEVRGGAGSEPTAELLPTDESPCFVLHGIQIEGVAPGQFPWLMDSLAGPDGHDSPLRRCVGARGAGLLLKRAQDAVLAHGFVTTRVLAPPQDLSAGTLNIQVISGRIHALRFDPLPAGGKAPASLLALPMQAGDVLNLRDIEQALENLQRVPSVQAGIQIVPATLDAPNQSDLLISWSQEQAARLTFSLDDSGGKGTGRMQGSATLSLDNPLGLSDLAYVTLNHDLNQELGSALANTAEGARGTRGYTAHYSLPMGYWLAAATFSSSRYYQNVPGLNQSYVYSGTSENNELKLSRVVYRDAARKSTLALKAWQRKSNNYVDDTEVLVQRRVVGGWELDFNHKDALGNATLEGSLSYKRGTSDFDAIDAPEEAFHEGTAKLDLLLLDLSVSKPFQAWGQDWRYIAALHVQDNSTPLTPQDRMAIGGRYTVRGFDGESSLVGERGWTLRNDWSLLLEGQELYLGLDAGEVSGPSSEYLPGKSLLGGVLGLRGSFKRPFGSMQYDLFVGGPFDKPSGLKTARITAGFSLTAAF